VIASLRLARPLESFAVTVTLVRPFLRPLTRPVLLTDTTRPSLGLKDSAWPIPSGLTLAPICSVWLIGRLYAPFTTGVPSGALSERSVTRSSTVIAQVAAMALWVVTVIVAAPRPMAVTVPPSTCATFGLLVDQAALRSWASSG